jgi:hypothetical protein
MNTICSFFYIYHVILLYITNQKYDLKSIYKLHKSINKAFVTAHLAVLKDSMRNPVKQANQRGRKNEKNHCNSYESLLNADTYTS